MDNLFNLLTKKLININFHVLFSICFTFATFEWGGGETHGIEVSKTHKVCIPKFIPISFWFIYLFFIMAVLVLHTTSAKAINI